MPIIAQIGRKSPKVRGLILTVYLVLILGAATMVYPFMIMLGGSTKSAADMSEFDPWPDYLSDDLALYRKHIEGLFNESIESMRMAYGGDVPSFEKVELPTHPNRLLVDEWETFLDETPLAHYTHACGYVHTPVSRTVPQALRQFKKEMMKLCDNDIEVANRRLGTEFAAWYSVIVWPEDYLPRRNKPRDSAFDLAFREFKARQPREDYFYFSPEGFFKTLFLKTQYTRKIDEYNATHGTEYPSYEVIHLARSMPDGTAKEREDWEYCVRHSLNLLWVRAEEGARPLYREFLKAKYGAIDVLNRNYETTYTSFEDIPLVDEPPMGGLPMSDWEAFISGWKDPDTQQLHIVPADMLRVHSVDFMFQDYIEGKYKRIERMNQALDTHFGGFSDVLPPQLEAHYRTFMDRRKALRWEFTTRNYKAVLGYLVFHGRGVVNTVIYCSLAVLCALIVNPLAAYAMSRFKMPSTYKILLFLMLTMAFPPMVTQIPVFLMLRQLHFLNTFAALILPGMANGYAIFLLKGFFDSLPSELYESASLDGANEWTMFWNITMSLSKPILAVIALQAFTLAYTNFMFALLICQDEKMWTLMVWLYQLRRWAGTGVIYASLIIAAIPTFLIFAFCQNIIMRGIVVPVEK